ncbi:CoA pyrophosphatase [Rosenbergiella australiborealis]|uniref:CoA pyrophosphatase n=1 Tax=Rosenbergiella australiborealis TaxID=1544696 RepID=UPI001F4D44A4|nr:CoA pyrophosphatase [Rosenbergiella australiborealis]
MNSLLAQFITRYRLNVMDNPDHNAIPHSAAVLLLIIQHPQTPTMLFTQRSYHLRHHAGQVAFPGGKRDPSDASLLNTALRETYEEIGIPADKITLIGPLPTINSRAGQRVKPFIGYVAPNITLTANTDEVAKIFQLPLAMLLNPHSYVALPITRHHTTQICHFLRHSEPMVWGMTATILYRLSQHVAMFPE